MIGKITLPHGEVATLEDDGTWTSKDETVAAGLNSSFDPREAAGWARRFAFGQQTVAEAAAAAGGTYELAQPLPKPEEGVVY